MNFVKGLGNIIKAFSPFIILILVSAISFSEPGPEDQAFAGWDEIPETSYFVHYDCPTGVRCIARCTTNLGDYSLRMVVGSRVMYDGGLWDIHIWDPLEEYHKRERDGLSDETHTTDQFSEDAPNGRFTHEKTEAQRHDYDVKVQQISQNNIVTVTATYNHRIERDDPCPNSLIKYYAYSSSEEDKAISECGVYENNALVDHAKAVHDNC